MSSELNRAYSKPEPRLLAFYLGRRADSKVRMISDIWHRDYNWLERTHDYIQWLFPLRRRSPHNPDAPILTEEIVQAFRSSDELRDHLMKSLKLMLDFYGLQLEQTGDKTLCVIKADEYPERKANWVSRGNHNFLRITRILASMRTLGLEEHAHALFNCLHRIYEDEQHIIGSRTFRFWKSASGN